MVLPLAATQCWICHPTKFSNFSSSSQMLLLLLSHSSHNLYIYYILLTCSLWDIWGGGASWSWSYGSWISNYLCNQCISPLTLWVRIQLMARWPRYNSMWYIWLVACGRSVLFSAFLHQWNRLPRYNWNIVESGVKHHNLNTWDIYRWMLSNQSPTTSINNFRYNEMSV
jgi:hypothetical protein